MPTYATQAEAEEAVLGRIQQRFTEKPELWTAYQQLPDEQRAQVKQQIQRNAAADIQVETGQTRPLMGSRITARVPVTRGFFDQQPERDLAADTQPAPEEMGTIEKVGRSFLANASRISANKLGGLADMLGKGAAATVNAGVPMMGFGGGVTLGSEKKLDLPEEKISEWLRDVADISGRAYGEDPEFAQSFAGQLMGGGMSFLDIASNYAMNPGLGVSSTLGQLYTEGVRNEEEELGKAYAQMTPQEKARTDTVAGLYSGVALGLELGPLRFLPKRLTGSTKEVLKKLKQPSILKEAAKGFLYEGGTEGSQKILGDELGKLIQQDGRDNWSADDLKEIFTNFAIGGIIGGGVRGGMATVGKLADKSTSTVEDPNAEQDLRNRMQERRDRINRQGKPGSGQQASGPTQETQTNPQAPNGGAEPAPVDGGATEQALNNFNQQLGMERLRAMLDDGLRTAQEADPNFDAFAAVRQEQGAASSPTAQGATTAGAKEGAGVILQSPDASSTQSPVSPESGGESNLSKYINEAQALSKTQLDKQRKAATRRKKEIQKQLDKGARDPAALQAEWQELQAKEEAFANEYAKRPDGERAKLADLDREDNEDFITYLNEATAHGGIPYTDKSIVASLSPALKSYFKKSNSTNDTVYDLFPGQIRKDIKNAGAQSNPEEMVRYIADRAEADMRAREATKERAKIIDYKGKQSQALFHNENRTSRQQVRSPIMVGQLEVGEKFYLKGEEFEVKGINEDGTIHLEDGQDFQVAPDTLIFVDRGQVLAPNYVSSDVDPLDGYDSPRDYVRQMREQNRAIKASFVNKHNIGAIAGYVKRGDLYMPKTGLSEQKSNPNRQLTKREADAERRKLVAEDKRMTELLGKAGELRELPPEYYEQLAAEQAEVSNDTTTAAPGELLANDNFQLTNEEATDSDAQLQAERDRRAADEAQGQMFDTKDVRGTEGEQGPTGNADFAAEGGGPSDSVRGAINSARAERPAGETDFQRFALTLNEMVEFARNLGKGAYPRVMEVIKRNPAIRGVFRSSEGDKESGSIEIQRGTYELLTPDEIAEVQADATDASYQAYLDELEASGQAGTTPPTKETYLKKLENDPQLQQQAEMIERQMLEEARREASLEREPVQALTTLAHEIGHWIDFLPQGLMSRGNVLGRIGSFSKYFKKMLPKENTGQDPNVDSEGFTLPRKDRERIRREVKKRIEDPLERAKEVKRLVEAEAVAQGYITLDAVRGELEALTSWWRLDGGELSDYHKKPSELYADAFSVLLNAPAELEARAPKFFAAFEAYLSNKQGALSAYDQMQEAIRLGESRNDMRGRLRTSLSKDSAVRTEQEPKVKGSEMWDGFTSMILREFQPFYRRAKRQSREGFEQSRDVIKNFLYRATQHELYLTRLSNEILDPLQEVGVDRVTMDEYMTYRHIVDNRYDIYSTLGISAKEANAALKDMRSNDPVGYAAMEAAQEQWFTLRKRLVIEPLRKSGVFNEELMQTIEERYTYAPARANKGGPAAKEGSFEQLLQKQFGKDTGMRIARQMGNLGEIKSPMNQLMGVDLRLMDFVKRNAAKAEVVRVMQTTDAKNIQPAEVRKVFIKGRYKDEPIHVENHRIGTMYVMREGEVSAYYVPKAIEAPFNKSANINDAWMVRAIYQANTLQKSIFTQINPGFWPIALARDILTRYRKMPSGEADKLRDFAPIGLAKDTAGILRAFRSSWGTVQSELDELNQLSYEKGDFISRRETIGHGNTFKGADIDRGLAEFKRGQGDFYEKHNKVMKQALKGWDFWLSIGQAFERAPKIATRQYLEQHHPNWSEAKKRNFIRQHGGSPDFLERGTVGPFMDFAMLFFNPAKEGWMSEADAYNIDPKGYMSRTAQTILPSLALKYAGLGLMGPAGYALTKSLMPWLPEDEEERDEMFRAVSHYDMMNYNIIPIRWADKQNKKLLYLRLPLDETSRIVVGTLMQPALQGGSMGEVLNYMGGQVPGNHPVIGLVNDWLTYMGGRNPYDKFMGREVIDPTSFKADEGTTDMLRHTWNNLGGSIVKRLQPERTSFAKKTQEEEFLEKPVVQNVIGRWFKVSNAGVRQRLAKHAEVEAAGRGAAKETLMAREIVDRMVNGKPLNDAMLEAMQYAPKVSEKVNRYLYETAKRAGPELEAIESLQTTEEKTAAWKVLGE